jgi:hypothetical protein
MLAATPVFLGLRWKSHAVWGDQFHCSAMMPLPCAQAMPLTPHTHNLFDASAVCHSARALTPRPGHSNQRSRMQRKSNQTLVAMRGTQTLMPELV